MTEAQAFPLTLSKDWEEHIPGMSLRDWFAGQALVGLLAGRQPSTAYPPEHLGKTSYTIADAMMAERGE